MRKRKVTELSIIIFSLWLRLEQLCEKYTATCSAIYTETNASQRITVFISGTAVSSAHEKMKLELSKPVLVNSAAA